MNEMTRRRLITAGSTVAILSGIGAAGVMSSGTPVLAGGEGASTRIKDVARDLARKDIAGNSLTPAYLKLLTGQLDISPKPRRIAVVGGGMAGLACADILVRAGHKVRLIEADPGRLGGRVRTLRTGWQHPGAYAEAGAMRIPDSHTLVTTLSRRLGVGLRPFLNAEPSRVLVANGQMTTQERYANKPRPLNSSFGVPGGQTARAILDEAFKPITDLVKNDSVEGWTTALASWDTWSLQRYLTDVGLTQQEQDLVGTLELLTPRMMLSLTHSYLTASALAPGARLWEVVGGTDTLATALAAKLPSGVVNKGWRLESVDSRPVTIRLGLIDANGGRDTLEADQVILAVPFSALRHVRFTPDISYGKRRAIAELHYDPASKVLLEFSKRWWSGQGGADISDTALRRTVYPSNPAGDGGIVLASYCWADDALAWDALGARERPEYALRILSDLYGSEVRKYYTGAHASQSWAQDPFCMGEAAVYGPGQAVEIGPDTRTSEADDRLFFAGDATSTRFRAWIEGALESACRVASAIGVEPDSKAASPPV